MKCRMSGGHSANAGNTAKIHRLCCSSIENSYWKKMWYVDDKLRKHVYNINNKILEFVSRKSTSQSRFYFIVGV